MPPWNLDRVEAAFAEAAVDPSLWVRALDIVTMETEASGALLLPVKGGALPSVPHTASMAASADTYFRDGWYLRDERYRGLPAILNKGVADDFDGMARENMPRHPYYQDFLGRHGLRWYAGVRVSCGEQFWLLSIQRSIDQLPFSPQEKERLVRLSTSLPTSIALSRALGTANASSALDSFEFSHTAAVLIDRGGRVIRANPSAERLLVGDVRIRDRRIAASDSAATAALERALHALIFRRDGAGLADPVKLPRRGRCPILAYPGRLPAMRANPLADCQAIVVLIDPGARKMPEAAMLRAAFGLTDAEARLAALLAAGGTLDDICARLQIAKETARNHLKSIFAKTGTHRQPDLVTMLNALLSRRHGSPEP